MQETKIIKVDGRKEKEKVIRNRARKCLLDRVIITDPTKNISDQLFDNAPTLYLNPTEKMHISNLIIPGSSLLTVLSSGDFAIEASFHGASEIVTFDINRNQYYPAALKVKGLQYMNYEDYWNFFSNDSSPDFLSADIYKNLKRQAEKDQLLYAFFDEIIAQKERDIDNLHKTLRKFGIDLNMLQQFSGSNGLTEIEIDEALNQMNIGYEQSPTFRTICGLPGMKTPGTYLENENAYRTAQERIKSVNISFIKTDLKRIKFSIDSTNNKKRFNSIYLSNIPEYFNGDIFANTVKEQLMPLLEENGIISYCCQATNIKTLNMSEQELTRLKNEARLMVGPTNIFSLYQLINSVEALKALRKEFEIDFQEEETLASANGLEENDTYVYIKKK